ncbi:hypothetical protein D7294_19920 [Streptomyces hoynatensis]|uniref:Berberine/berberine-like domain-containing protein n=1 Tax=Streptomyces hoynatensis TaxID=1141874 RepID=A0A3A9YUI0_9ACTN|nr:hypothetical protein D7294_19920 [Streptomyces hoynatensis]
MCLPGLLRELLNGARRGRDAPGPAARGVPRRVRPHRRLPGPRTCHRRLRHRRPDPDILDPAWNASGVPRHAFHFGENYPRLQRAKARWDAGDVFRHALSVRLP